MLSSRYMLSYKTFLAPLSMGLFIALAEVHRAHSEDSQLQERFYVVGTILQHKPEGAPTGVMMLKDTQSQSNLVVELGKAFTIDQELYVILRIDHHGVYIGNEQNSVMLSYDDSQRNKAEEQNWVYDAPEDLIEDISYAKVSDTSDATSYAQQSAASKNKGPNTYAPVNKADWQPAEQARRSSQSSVDYNEYDGYAADEEYDY